MNEEYNCEFCDKQMTEEEHHFCDICSDCREENDEEIEDDIVLLVSRVTK
jgi:Zn finger protein HypA/HybF involved in hydrogenase expression